MAGNIKGITIEIGGETTGLEKALKDVNSQSISLQGELKQVDKLLKFNPGNAELVAQKQEILSKQIMTTTEKLNRLKDADKEVQEQFASGKINDEQYRAFQRELVSTEGALNGLKGKLASLEQEQKNIESSTKQLNNVFEVTGKSLDDYSDVLGSKLVNAIKGGTASSKQLDDAIAKIGKEALGANTDIDKMKKALSQLDDGASIDKVRKDFNSLSKEADESKKAISDVGVEIENVAGALIAGGGIAGAIEQALDTSKLNTKINISMDVPPESVKSVKDAINTVSSYGVDAEEALEGVRRQWALNKNASDESNSAVVKGAAAIAAAYNGIDFNELIQETNEIGVSLDITNEDALGLVNSLLKIGFPPEQLDIIAEYGTQLQMAGYSAEEVQAIMAAGVDTGTWNIDNLLDGLKEGRIKAAEFGQEVPKAMQELIQGTNISTQQLQTWGKAVAAGGEGGSQAMKSIAVALNNVDDETKRNALGVQLFGTMWEDQGQAIINTLINADTATVNLKSNQDELNQSVAALNADPTVQMQKAISDLKIALEPLLVIIANVIAKVAEWISNNPTLAATIAAIVTVLGILVGIFMALAPILTVLGAAATALGIGLAPLVGIIAAIVAAITALIAIGTYLYNNWDEIKAKAAEIWTSIKESLIAIWESIKESVATVWNGVKEFFSSLWEGIKQVCMDTWNSIVSFFTETIPGWIENIGQWFMQLPEKIGYALGYALGTIAKWGIDLYTWVTTEIPKIVDGIIKWFKELPGKVWDWLVKTWDKFKKWFIDMNTTAAEGVAKVINSIINWFKQLPGKIYTWINDALNKVKTWCSNLINTAKTEIPKFVQSIVDYMKELPGKMVDIGVNIVKGIWEGIKNMGNWIKDMVGNFIDGLVDGAKDALGIHSPSRVMRDQVGKYMAQGIAVGFQDEMKSVNGIIRKGLDNTVKVSADATNFSNGNQPMTSKSNGTIINLHVNSPTALNPYETARQARNELVKLGLNF